MSIGKLSAVVAVAIAVVVGLVMWLDSTLPNSTAGIAIVGGNTARVPEGEDFVLTHTTSCGKGCTSTSVWHVTYDGNQTVNFRKRRRALVL